jgi:zona occludens toxin (predicted ATPase)
MPPDEIQEQATEAAVARADAIVADATAEAAERAVNAANSVVAQSAVVAAVAQEQAAQQVQDIAVRTGEVLNNQEESLEWLREHARVTQETQTEMLSRLNQMSERTATLETTMGRTVELLALLTPPVLQTETPSPERQPENPSSVAVDAQREAASAEQRASARKNKRFI